MGKEIGQFIPVSITPAKSACGYEQLSMCRDLIS